MVENEDFITCRICKAKRRLITIKHLHMHGYTMEQYRNEFPDAPLICEASKKRNSESRKNQKAINEAKEKLEESKPISLDYVKCEICDKFLREIGITHTRKHGITVQEYKRRFPNSKLRGKSTQDAHDQIAKIAVPRMNEKYRKLLKDPEFLKMKSEAQLRGYAKLASDPERYAEYLKKCENGRFARRLPCTFDSDLLFRSRPEVELAEILHKEGLPVIYETFLLKMPNGKNYLPDFYIPGANLIIEVKGRAFYDEYCDYRRDNCIKMGFKYEFIFDDENVRERFDQIVQKYKLMI